MMFIEILALRNGFQLDFAKISNEEMLRDSVETINLEYELMSELLLRALSIKE